jgi:FMN phosphatase YigB (HAD superfamily)
MMKNDGVKTNEQIFWDSFALVCGEGIREKYPVFEEFYRENFDKEVRSSCGFNPESARTVHYMKERGLTVALATNPVFPAMATESRIRWAGLSPSDFALYTTYENSHYTKPVLNYYREIIEKLGVCAEECLMVGNDVGDDMVAEKLGMKVFLLTDCLINKDGADISRYPNGSFAELIKYTESLI